MGAFLNQYSDVRCSECIRGENAVALAAQPANRVIGRRIHPSRSPSRASSRRAVCFKDLRVGFFFFAFLCSLSFFSSSSRPSVSPHVRLLSLLRLRFSRLPPSNTGDAAALAAGDLKVARKEYSDRPTVLKLL